LSQLQSKSSTVRTFHIEVTDFLYLVEAEVVFMCAIKSIAYNSILTWPRSVSDVEQELYIFTGHM
jgi:hypothetical protein